MYPVCISISISIYSSRTYSLSDAIRGATRAPVWPWPLTYPPKFGHVTEILCWKYVPILTFIDVRFLKCLVINRRIRGPVAIQLVDVINYTKYRNRSVGLEFVNGSNFGHSHRNDKSPLTQGRVPTVIRSAWGPKLKFMFFYFFKLPIGTPPVLSWHMGQFYRFLQGHRW